MQILIYIFPLIYGVYKASVASYIGPLILEKIHLQVSTPSSIQKFWYLQVSDAVDEQILRLQISIDQVQRAQVLQGHHDLGSVESRWDSEKRPNRRRSETPGPGCCCPGKMFLVLFLSYYLIILNKVQFKK